MRARIPALATLCALLAAAGAAQDEAVFARARARSRRFDQSLAAAQRLLKAWLAEADPRTLLLPDHLPGARFWPRDTRRFYTPENSGADLYAHLVLTARLTDPDLYQGRMLEVLRNEVRFTTIVDSIPGGLDLETGALLPSRLADAGEYAKDGLVPITELLGRTPWFYRMADLAADLMQNAPVASRFGKLPSREAEWNGNLLQVLPRLAAITGEPRFLGWAERIGDAYVEEVLPRSHGLPPLAWDFDLHRGDGRVAFGDHGNEAIVGLVLLYDLEQARGLPRSTRYRPVLGRMLDRILAAARPDGMLPRVVDAATLAPVEASLTDNWGYVYGAIYAFYQATGESRYREAVRHVLASLPRYRGYDWQEGSFDGHADAIEGALYLANREPVPEALDWIESETRALLAMQQPSGHLEHWYAEGNFNRTLLLYALYQSQGCRAEPWWPGLGLGAARDGDRLRLSVTGEAAASGWKGKVRFDFARHRRVLNLDRNYVRLNEFPEWYTVDENTLYRVRPAAGEARLLLGSELIEGIPMVLGDWTIEPAGRPPYGPRAQGHP